MPHPVTPWVNRCVKPATNNLSRQAVEELPTALELLKQIDLQMLDVLESKLPEVKILAMEIKDTLDSGGNIFMSGCGSTGRPCRRGCMAWPWAVSPTWGC